MRNHPAVSTEARRIRLQTTLAGFQGSVATPVHMEQGSAYAKAQVSLLQH